MKGVILAGGTGSRLSPLTIAVNKHLLPIYDKPLIYYPLSTLMLAGIKEFLLITNEENIRIFKKLLGSGTQFGISIDYTAQPKPEGIANALSYAEDFAAGSKIGVILGDNVFHGMGLGRQLANNQNIYGAKVFAYKVGNPQDYGVVRIDQAGAPLDLIEKPTEFVSDMAITGLYFYDETVFNRIKDLKPSARGEFEITSLNKSYLEDQKLEVELLSQGTAWLDTGSPHGLNDASNYIRVIQERQNSQVGDPVTVAQVLQWI